MIFVLRGTFLLTPGTFQSAAPRFNCSSISVRGVFSK